MSSLHEPRSLPREVQLSAAPGGVDSGPPARVAATVRAAPAGVAVRVRETG
jgi:hypothetical protein